MQHKGIFKLLISVALPLGAGFIGSLFTTPAVPGWYATLTLPPLTPPGWVFGPVWTVLYVLMGVALFLVWRKGVAESRVRVGLYWFGLQLGLNAFWSYLFFGLQAPGVALVEIGFLLLAIIATMVAFRRVSVWAAWLLLPYLLWVMFASYLNYMIWLVN